MDWTWYLFRFDGRMGRALLWQALLIVALLTTLLDVIGQIIHLSNADGSLQLSLKLDFDFGLGDLFKLLDHRVYPALTSADRGPLILRTFGTALFLWIFLATAIKRLHDRDKSGWWLVPFFLVPGLFNQFSDLVPDSHWMLPVHLGAGMLWLWGLVEMFCVPGSVGDNRFGPAPLARIEDTAAPSATSAKVWDQSREIEFVPPRASPPGGMHVKRSA
ncbi:DUF805 domain-containing protein [Bradyrhizobium daqingense]|uniref:Uncharacterized membrane protein YhaH (DUF805 family) n=2 Tax=Bradyrhizobium daqingense TaxID=993502 RepID=A0A562KNI7_9BRAD|nr:DUF805 domain-containing protein [Bradyrhizobium daqingense]TWH96932.1 uncharacterized membrane protein YhaH (DUF805 family) [Bradyrhizobium daqingense]UFS92708.1 DUF805 domain-containing protein [Bradyrhizobium daqingense]